jgi:hypothetical protein
MRPVPPFFADLRAVGLHVLTTAFDVDNDEDWRLAMAIARRVIPAPSEVIRRATKG